MPWLKAWYGPVSTPDECKSEGRTAELIFKNNKKPSELCKDVCIFITKTQYMNVKNTQFSIFLD